MSFIPIGTINCNDNVDIVLWQVGERVFIPTYSITITTDVNNPYDAIKICKKNLTNFKAFKLYRIKQEYIDYFLNGECSTKESNYDTLSEYDVEMCARGWELPVDEVKNMLTEIDESED